MIRFFVFGLISLFILSVVRMIATALMKGVGEMMGTPQQAGERTASPPPQRDANPGGALKRDPVCGTFVPASSAVKRTVNGQVIHFCSAECRDKFVA